MDRKQNNERNGMARAIRVLFCISSLTLASCVSYSYTGIAQADKLPDEGIIGMTRDDLINAYGIPERVVPIGENQNAPPEGQGQPGRGPSLSDDHVIYMYHRTAQHKVIVYQRTRGDTYAVYLMNGKVAQVKTTVT